MSEHEVQNMVKSQEWEIQCQGDRSELITLTGGDGREEIKTGRRLLWREGEKSELWNGMDFKGEEAVQMRNREKRFWELTVWKSLHCLAELGWFG